MFSDNGGPSDRDRLHEAYKEIRRLQEALAAAQAPPASAPNIIGYAADGSPLVRVVTMNAAGHTDEGIYAMPRPKAPTASDPPGQQPETAEALIKRWQHWCGKFGEAAADEDDDGDTRMAQEQIWAVEADMLAYPLPASPQAKETP